MVGIELFGSCDNCTSQKHPCANCILESGTGMCTRCHCRTVTFGCARCGGTECEPRACKVCAGKKNPCDACHKERLLCTRCHGSGKKYKMQCNRCKGDTKDPCLMMYPQYSCSCKGKNKLKPSCKRVLPSSRRLRGNRPIHAFCVR